MVETKTPIDIVELVAYQQDKRREWEQTQILKTLLEDAPHSLVGLEQVFVSSMCNVGLYIAFFGVCAHRNIIFVTGSVQTSLLI